MLHTWTTNATNSEQAIHEIPQLKGEMKKKRMQKMFSSQFIWNSRLSDHGLRETAGLGSRMTTELPGPTILFTTGFLPSIVHHSMTYLKPYIGNWSYLKANNVVLPVTISTQ